MTTHVTEAHVSCDSYCGMRITMTGEAGKAQHAENCGAKAEDLKALDDALSAKRVHAAIPAEELDEAIPPAAPPATFRCSCGETFPGWVELGDHQTAERHSGMWTEPEDALDDEALSERDDESTTVDGAQAKIKHGGTAKGAKAGEKVDYSHLWRDPLISVTDVTTLQRKIDNGEITIGGIAAGKACIGKDTFTDPNDNSVVEVACPHKCFARTVRSNECSLEHTHTETLEQVCLIHAVTSWGAEAPPAGRGPLLHGVD